MSQAVVSSPRTARAFRRPVQAVGPRLQLLVSPVENARRIPFLVSCIAVCLTGLLALLGLNISLSKGSYEVYQLQREQTRLAESEQQLAEQVAIERSPASVSAKAKALGMIPSASPVFLRLSDGQIIGDPREASASQVAASADLATARDSDPRIRARQQVAHDAALARQREMERASIGTAERRPAANPGTPANSGTSAKSAPAGAAPAPSSGTAGAAAPKVPTTAAQRGDGAVPIRGAGG